MPFSIQEFFSIIFRTYMACDDSYRSDSKVSSQIDFEIRVNFPEMNASKRYKEKTMKEIVSTFCGVVNSHGGRIRLELESGTGKDVSNLKRGIEQRISDMLGFSMMRDTVNVVHSSMSQMIFKVDDTSLFCTLNYNLCVPTETQVLSVPSNTPIQDVQEILCCKERLIEVDEIVTLGTHCKEFVLEQQVTDEVHDSKRTQLKHLKAEKSKCVSLADRMTNKSNKLAHYVSAFANHRGGHIYYGVDEYGMIKGEFVENREEIVKKVTKVINKMVWPMKDDGPKRGEHWEIFFEPVRDVIGNVIPSTFVIVVTVTLCAGGVFTEVPECYHVVGGKVIKMEFTDWMGKLSESSLPINVSRAKWSSGKAKNAFYSLMETMHFLRNDGNKEVFEHQLKRKLYSTQTEECLVICMQKAAFAWRRGEKTVAKSSIEDYQKFLAKCENDVFVFQSIGHYLKSLNERFETNYQKSFEISETILQNLEFIPVGLCASWLYLHVANLLTMLPFTSETDHNAQISQAKTYYSKALEHGKYMEGFSRSCTDVEQMVYIHLASLYLSCSVNGTMDSGTVVSREDIESAKNCLMMVNQLIHEGYPLSRLRQIQYFLVQSSLLLRQAQLPDSTQESRSSQLEYSLQVCGDAHKLSIESNFGEMIRYSCHQTHFIAAEIDRYGVQRLKLNDEWEPTTKFV